MRRMLGALPLLLTGCATLGTAPEPQLYRGYYASGFEVEAFTPCGGKEQWWVTEGTTLRQRYQALAPRPYERVYVELRGDAGPTGRYGHMSAYTRELAVSEVLEMHAPRQGDCE